MAVQTTYDYNRTQAVAGMLADSGPHTIHSVIVEGATAAGLCVVQGSTTKTEGTPPAAPTADVDAIIATGASTAGVQSLTTTSLDGVVGQGVIVPAKNLTFTFSSHSDWDATTATVYGEDSDGNMISETFSIPNGGNATVTGNSFFRRVITVNIPAQTGTGGTFTLGTGTKLGPLDGYVHGVSVYDASREPGAWPVDSVMPVCRKGPVWVYAEGAVNPSLPVYVRFVVTGSEVLGAFRGSVDSTDCGELRNARWLDTTSAAGFARLDLNLP